MSIDKQVKHMDGQLYHTHMPNRRPVLTVDHDQLVNDRIAAFLGEAGFVVDSCTCPFQAYERCASAPGYYGLVFIEARFPAGEVGFEVAKRIAGFRDVDGPGVIGMASDAALYEPEHQSRWGMADMILKPLFKWLVINLATEHCVFDTHNMARAEA